MKFSGKISRHNVHSADDMEFGKYVQTYKFGAILLVYFLEPNILNVVSSNKQSKLPKLSQYLNKQSYKIPKKYIKKMFISKNRFEHRVMYVQKIIFFPLNI